MKKPAQRLPYSAGIKHIGTLPEFGFEFGRWLDLAVYQLLLDTPKYPVEE